MKRVSCAARGVCQALILFIICFIPQSIQPQAGVLSVYDHSSKHILENGMTVLVSEMPESPVVSLYALVKAGSATEGEFLGTGISHFLEHMLFKGTERRKAGEIASAIQAVGGMINASTGYDYTIFTINVPPEAFDTALDVLADALMHSNFDPQEIEKERHVIFGEMRLGRDNPDRRLNELTFQTAYIRHPYRHPIIGYQSLFDEITREDLLKYLKAYYHPNNIILSLAGNVQASSVLLQIEDAFKDFKRSVEMPRNLPKEPRQISPRFFVEEYQTDLTRMSMAFSSVSLLDSDLFALDVLANVLGQGASSRLYREVYKRRGLVHSISASNYTPMDQGLFWIECVLEQEHIEETKKAVSEIINDIQKQGITRQELDKAKRQVLSGHIFSQQTSSHIAYSQAVDEAYTGDYRFSEKYVQGIQKVSLKDIQRAAQEYLIGDALTTVILEPKTLEEERSSVPEKNAAFDIQKIILENGVTLLIKENHTLPIVSLRLSLQGGIRQEMPELNGVSSIVSSMLVKGTAKRSAEDIAQEAESLGIEIGIFSGRNSLGLDLEFLSQDWKKATDIFEDMVLRSRFPEEELFRIKELMKISIRARQDSIFEVSQKVLRELLFFKHPFRLDEEGTLESLERIERGDVIDFYKRLAVPSNMVISIFGDINTQSVVTLMKKKFGKIKSQPFTLASYQEEPITEPRSKEVEMPKEQAMVMVGFHGPSLKDNDRCGTEVLISILGSSFSGRLFNKIREEFGHAYTLGGNYLPSVDAGLIYFYVLTAQDEVEEVKNLLTQEIERIQREEVSGQELSDMKTYLKGTFKQQLETNASLSFTSSLDELYGLGFDRYKQYEGLIDQVSPQDVQKLAQKYLDLKKSAFVITMPSNIKNKPEN